MKTIAIATPNELLETLKGIFPEYSFESAEGGMEDLNFHGLLLDFNYYYGKHNPTFTERQVKGFAEIVNKAIDAGGSLENALGTCLLEHLGQRASKPLKSFLSKAAKERMHA